MGASKAVSEGATVSLCVSAFYDLINSEGGKCFGTLNFLSWGGKSVIF